MTTNVTMVIMFVAYAFGVISKLFIAKIPNKYLPLQNLLIGFISALICFFAKLEPNFGEALIVCLMATMSAGGISDLIKHLKTEINPEDNDSDLG